MSKRKASSKCVLISETISKSSSHEEQSAQAANGDHEVEEFLRHGHTWYKGVKRHVYVTKWKPTLTLGEHVQTDKEIPYGLKPEDHLLPKSWDAEEVRAEESKHRCRWCRRGLSCRKSQLRHEKICNISGAPGHDCTKSNCPPGSNCKKAIWTPPPDGRFGNPNSGRPKKQRRRSED